MNFTLDVTLGAVLHALAMIVAIVWVTRFGIHYIKKRFDHSDNQQDRILDAIQKDDSE